MSKNALSGLIGNYGDSDEESDDGSIQAASKIAAASGTENSTAAIHPPPIPHCPWSACYDDTSGFTYYWNQNTNAVTWEAPREYLLALKLAQQQLTTSGSTEVSAEEWQLYQQALAEKQNVQKKEAPKIVPNVAAKSINKNEKVGNTNKNGSNKNKRSLSADDEEKIELITSYSNTDSESNDEAESPVKTPAATAAKPALPRNPHKKQKTKPAVVEYGPSLPPNQNYTVPIGPELPPEVIVEDKPKSPVIEANVENEEVKNSTKANDNEDSQDESTLLLKLKSQAKILEKLGGEIPSELHKIIHDNSRSGTSSPKAVDENSKDSKSMDTNIDDLLDEIEKKELPKAKSKVKIDMFGDDENYKSANNSGKNSPKSGDRTPPLDGAFKPLFPSSQAIAEETEPVKPVSLFPSVVNIEEVPVEVKTKAEVAEKKGANLYLSDANEVVNTNRKKLRISNSVLPERKVSETPSYTTKYSQHIDGFAGERTGLGFSKNDDEEVEQSKATKSTISYGNGLMFTKGETLNDGKKDDELGEMVELVEAKLKYLNQLQPCTVTPVQEMVIQMQTLTAAIAGGALLPGYWRRWVSAADAALAAHEAAAAPQGWTCSFQRSAGRYRYVRASDGLSQYEYPGHCDMDICTTPPHPGIEAKEEAPPPPPLPPPPPPPAPPAPPPRVATPPPPAWRDPPPPGCDDPPPLPQEPPPPPPMKQEIGEELLSFYNDIAEIEKQTTDSQPLSQPSSQSSSQSSQTLGQSSQTLSQYSQSSGPHLSQSSGTHTAGSSPEHSQESKDGEKLKEKEVKKKKTKVKISSSIGMKHKSVSSLVAKWQQVAEEINSD